MESLTQINLDNLLVQLRPEVSSCWHQFGLAIQVEKETLDAIAKTCSPKECIVELFDVWLRNYKGQPTWGEIINALKTIGLMKLALDIERVHKTGMNCYVIKMCL